MVQTRAGLLDTTPRTKGPRNHATKALIKMGYLVDTGGDLIRVERTLVSSWKRSGRESTTKNLKSRR